MSIRVIAPFAVLALAACGSRGAGDLPVPAEEDAADPAAAFEGCRTDVPAFALDQSIIGDAGLLAATVIAASPFPARKYANEWTLEITGANGESLGEAGVDRVETSMPLHGHPGPVATVEALPDPGRFMVVLQLDMRGQWMVEVEARSASTGDRVVFHVCVED